MKRMEQLKTLIPKHCILADIGTDHGYLPVLAVSDHTAVKAYACDVAPGPLSQAEETIARAGLRDKIIPVLSNGFEKVPMDVNAAVIAGMGFYTARDILEKAMPRLALLSDIIVQINSDVPLFRKWISEHGFTIRKELSIEDRGKFYTAIVFDTEPHSPYSREALLRGDLDTIVDREAFVKQLHDRCEKLRRIIGLRNSAGDPAEEMAGEFSILLDTIKRMEN